MPLEHSEVSIRTGVEPEWNLRHWFQSLASGLDRCMATAIADEAFIETVISLACVGGCSRGNKSRKPNHGALINLQYSK